MTAGMAKESSDGAQEPQDINDLPLEEEEYPLPPLPPDGGWGWVIVFASFIINVIVDGVTFSFGIFYLSFQEYFGESAGKTAWVGSLIPGMYLGIGPIVSALINKFGARKITIIGAVLAGISFFISTFSPNIDVLIITYGLCGGISFGLMYLPSIVIVNFYFNANRALATGIAVSGSGIGTLVFAPLGQFLLEEYGWKGGYWIIAGIILNGVVCGAVFRPLTVEPSKPKKILTPEELERKAEKEAKKKKKKKSKEPDEGDLKEGIKKSIIMQTILAEKRRQRTISTGSLDGTYIMKDNTLLKDPEMIKRLQQKVMLQKLDELEEPTEAHGVGDSSESKSLLQNKPLGSKKALNGGLAHGNNNNTQLKVQDRIGNIRAKSNNELGEQKNNRSQTIDLEDFRERTLSGGSGKLPLNKHLARVRSIDGFAPRRRTLTASSQKDIHSLGGSRVSLSEAGKAKEVSRPLYRQDIFYSGSIQNIAEYKSQHDVSTYIQSVTSLPSVPEEEDTNPCLPIQHVLSEMFDFSLMKSVTFSLMATCSVLAMTGFFTPFVHLPSMAIKKGIAATQATLLLSILGGCNTAGRIVWGWISDRPWADCILIHNFCLIIAGLATCLVPLFNSYWLMVIYCAIFGACIAAYIMLRSIVLVELLGLQKLTNSFGLVLLFQGIASLIGSPVAGMLFDATSSYVTPFVVSGILIALAGIILLPIRWVSQWERKRQGHLVDANGYEDEEYMAMTQQEDVVVDRENMDDDDEEQDPELLIAQIEDEMAAI